MSRSAKDLIREFLKVTDAQEFGRYDDLLTGDMIAHFPGGADMDRQQVEQNERTFATAFPDITRTVEDLISEGDRVVARATVRGTHQGEFSGIAPTGRAVEATAIAIYRVRDGRIAESWVEADFLGLLAQLQA